MRNMKKIRYGKFQSMTYNGKWGFRSNYPFLRLSGKWMEDAGFKIDETCQVNVFKNKIIITKTIKDDTRKKVSTSKRNEAENMERP